MNNLSAEACRTLSSDRPGWDRSELASGSGEQWDFHDSEAASQAKTGELFCFVLFFLFFQQTEEGLVGSA